MSHEARFRDIVDQLVQAHSRTANFVQFGNPISAHQYLRLYRLVANHVEHGSRVLDWGAGNGHFSYFLARSGYRACGFDLGEPPSLDGLTVPETCTFASASPADPSTLPFENESFDAVASVGVLEHVRETGGRETASLREIHRILKPGGVFICFHLPNRYSWIEAALRLVHRWSHRYRYTAGEIAALARQAGLTVEGMGRYAMLPRNIWWWGPLKQVSGSHRVADIYDACDDALAIVASPFCQNYWFVARKPGPHRAAPSRARGLRGGHAS